MASIALLHRIGLAKAGDLLLQMRRDALVTLADQVRAWDLRPSTILDHSVPARAGLEIQLLGLSLGLVRRQVIEESVRCVFTPKLVALDAC